MSQFVPFPREHLGEIAPACEEEINDHLNLARMPISQAGELWLESRRPYIAASTFADYRKYLRTLAGIFGPTLLGAITADQIRVYQRARLATAQGGIINKETSVLQQCLKRIGRWTEIAADFQPLPLEKESPGRAITDEEEAKFFRAGLGNLNWCVAAWASLISINTTAGPGEILHLRIRDLDVIDKLTLRVNAEGAKNGERIRVIPLNEPAAWAAKLLLTRAKALGFTQPEHFVIPFYLAPGKYDPTRPQTHYYKSFNEILATADLKFRPYDFRHTCITRMLEAGVPEETVIAMAGHVSRAMLKRYSHIRLEAKRAAVLALASNLPAGIRSMLGPPALRLDHHVHQSEELHHV